MPSITDILARKPRNIAIKATADHDLNVVDVDEPESGPAECLVNVRTTGICGSDEHFWKSGRIGHSIIAQSCGLGHESAGLEIKTSVDVEGP